VRAPFPRRVPLLAELGTELPCDSRPGEFCFVTATQSLSVDYENAVDALGKDTETACIYVAGINGLDNLTGVDRYRFFVMWFHVLRAAAMRGWFEFTIAAAWGILHRCGTARISTGPR
jgi:hypothetical protein